MGKNKLTVSSEHGRNGSYIFELRRVKRQQALKINLGFDNNMSCSEELPPEPRLHVSVKIWPEGRNWKGTSTEARYQQNVGCPGGRQQRVMEFCLPDKLAKVTNIEQPEIISNNCPVGASYFDKINVIAGRPNCIQAVGSLKGCGYGSFKICKGTGWLDAKLRFSGITPSGAQTSAPEVSETRLYHDLYESDQFDYKQPLPTEFVIDRWRFTAQIKEGFKGGVRTFVLTNEQPSQNGCTANVSGSGSREGFVYIKCQPDSYLAKGIDKALLDINTPINRPHK